MEMTGLGLGLGLGLCHNEACLSAEIAASGDAYNGFGHGRDSGGHYT